MIHHGDLFDVLPTFEAESLHACVTDPPYGIGFMGKEWDTFSPGSGLARIVPNRAQASTNPNLRGRQRGPASSPSAVEYDYSQKGLARFQWWTEKWARQVFRVLKPGAHLIVCGAPRSHHRMMCGVEDAGFEIRDCLAWIFGQGFPKSKNLGAGWGTALKPGHEPIVLARKPFKLSTQRNHDIYRTAGLNIDECRIELLKPDVKSIAKTTEPQGRWPANVLLNDEAAAMLDEQSGELVSGFSEGFDGEPTASVAYGKYARNAIKPETVYADRGGASRFFYVAKPSREERDLGCDLIEPRQRDESRKDGNPGGDNPRNRGLQRRGNFHPTVKPLALMRWLVRLVTPVGGTVLDPFGGSGTTAMACAAEGFDFVLIEREAEYIPIIEARVRAIAPLFTESA